MLVNDDKRHLAGVTAAVVTTAAFAKMFLPFYLIGSSPIFAATSLVGVLLIAISWRQISVLTSKVTDILVLLAALYGLVITNFLFYSRPAVPTTHLVGILIFHAMFIIFGFAAARALKAVQLMLLGAAVIYVIVIAQYTVRFGDLEQGGYLHDVFGVGNPALAVALHQEIGITLGLAALAALGLASNRIRRILAIGALPLVLLFLFHISARAAIVALVCSLMFLTVAGLWVRSKELALFTVIAAIVVVTLATSLFYQHALRDKDIDAVAPDAASRTIREIQNTDPGLRLQIWTELWRRVSTEPDRLLLGRGIGMYPVNEGFGPPDWLLHRTEGSKHYPHNVHLEMLYETGVVGLLLFSIVTLFPVVISLRHWQSFSLPQKSAVSMYVFHLVGSEFSGAFAFQYLDQFFFALTVGIIALKRTDDILVSSRCKNLKPTHPTHALL